MPEVRGTRAGLVVLAGIATVNTGNALFQLIAARHLGPADYAEVVSLLALAGLIGLPFGALQILVARYVAAGAARNDRGTIASVTRRNLALAGTLAVAACVLLLAFAPALRRVLSIDGWWPLVLTALVALPALPTPVLWGLAQGLQKFGTLSFSMASGTMIRLVGIVALTATGLSVSGALGVTLLGSGVSFLVPLLLLGGWMRRAPTTGEVPGNSELARAAIPIAVGTLAIASLTTADLIVAKIALSDEAAGIYGGASLLGRLLLYVPATIATVLLPKVSSRVAAARDTDDILGASLAVTVLISLGLLAVLVLAPTFIVGSSLGGNYEAAAPLIGLFGAAMMGCAILNVLLTYHLGLGSSAMSWLLLGGAFAQLAGYAVFHGSTYQLIGVNIVTAGALILIHELAIKNSGRLAARWVTAFTLAVVRRA